MVKPGAARGKAAGKAGAAGFLCLVILTLASCGFLLDGPFQASLTLVTARRDLTALVPRSEASSFLLSTVTVGAYDYVVLSSSLQTDGTRLVIMSPDLQILFSYTTADLAGLGLQPAWGRAVLEAAGNLVVGNARFSVGAAGITGPPAPSNGFETNGFSYENGAGVRRNVPRMQASGNGLSYPLYDSSWVRIGAGDIGPIAVRASPAANTSFSVSSAWSDPDTRQVVLFLHDQGDSQDYFLFIPWADLDPGALKAPLLGSYPSYSKAPTDSSRIGYSQGGIIRFVPDGSSTGTFIRSDAAGNDLPNGLRYMNAQNATFAYRISGGFFYSFDSRTCSLMRMSAWW